MRAQHAGEDRSLALIFLITFSVLSLIFIGLLSVQVAQVLTRSGNCTVLSSRLTATDINDAGGQNDGKLYYISFTVLLQTSGGQHVRVPAYYGSSNYNFGDQASAQNALKQYAVGSTQTCSYTYLDPSGTTALFAPMLPLEGIFFVSALLIGSLVLTIICIVALRKRSQPAPTLLDEVAVEAP